MNFIFVSCHVFTRVLILGLCSILMLVAGKGYNFRKTDSYVGVMTC